jgi:hypothetical protein
MLKNLSKTFSKMFNCLLNDAFSEAEHGDDLIILNSYSDEQKNTTATTSTLLISYIYDYLFILNILN